MNKSGLLALFRVSLIIAVLIFLTSILSDFCVRMVNSGEGYNPLLRVLIVFGSVIMMALLIMFALWMMPDIRKAISRMFGIDETEEKKSSDEK